MAKTKYKTMWFCTECGASSTKWEGKCPSCGAWNTMTEERVVAGPATMTKSGSLTGVSKTVPQTVDSIDTKEEPRLRMPSVELNRVLGGGLVAGSMVLVGGEPGIGKSTLVLQNLLAIKSKTVLYVSGEESASQIKMRAARLGRGSENVYIVCETSLENIFSHIEKVKPEILIVDSIQTIASDTLESAAGSISQVRECAAQLLRFAKQTTTPVILIGHITKDGNLAGPKVLEHIVDAVLHFEGDSKYMYRILRPVKNRFGSTNELGIYEMGQKGLREVTNPSGLLVTHRENPVSGVAVGVTVDGARPFLIEAEALVSSAAYGTPQRTVTGFDTKRLNMLLAVLEKRAGFRLSQKDVFLNIAGGLRVNDPALDLAVIAAVISSNVDIAIGQDWCMSGEVGLTGEIRAVSRMEQRILEAQKLGMTNMIVPRSSIQGLDMDSIKIKVYPVARVEEALRLLLKQ